MPRKLERFRIHKIDVGRRDGKNDTVGLRDVFGDEVARLLLDVCRLVANGYLQLLARAISCGVIDKPLSDQASLPRSGLGHVENRF